MIEALKDRLRAMVIDAATEASWNIAKSMLLMAMASGNRPVSIRPRLTPRRYAGLRTRRLTQRQRADLHVRAASSFTQAGALAIAARATMGEP